MVPMDSFDEVAVIADFVTHSRDSYNFMYEDTMDLDQRYNQTQTVRLDGNISYLVVDTNFILSHLKILNEIKDLGKEYGLQLVIPMAVMQELDGLKLSNKIESAFTHSDAQLSGKSVGHLARWANDWVYSCLAKRVPTVVGQRAEERINRLAVKDDAILDCCLYLQKHRAQTLQILMSNDKNLCMKALLNSILTVSYRTNMNAKMIAETIRNENIHKFGVIQKNTVVTQEVEVPIRAHHGGDIFQTVYGEVQKLVLSIVHRCMASNYGEDLSLLRNYNKSAVQTLEDACHVIIRFWMPVFSLYLRRLKPFDEEGKHKVPKMVDVPQSRLSLNSFIDYWSQILHTLYKEEMTDAQNTALGSLIQRWEELAESV